MAHFGKKQAIPSPNSSPSKRNKSRIFLKLVAGLVGLFVLLAILIVSIDINTFRDSVAEELSRAAGVRVKIEYLGWDFSGGLRFQCGGVQIFTEDAGEELMSTKDLFVSLKWIPLLKQRVVIDSVTLVEPILKVPILSSSKNPVLPQSKQTNSNGSLKPSQPMSEESSVSNVIHGMREFLENPKITLTEINLIAGQVSFQDRTAGREVIMNADARMRVQRDEDGVNLILDGIKLSTGNLVLQGDVRAEDILSSDSHTQVKTQMDPFEISDLDPILNWIPEHRDTLNKKLKLKGKFPALELKLSAPTEALEDFNALVGSVEAKLILKGEEMSLVQFGKAISVSTVEAAVQWADQEWRHNITLGVLGGSLGTEGKLSHKKGSSSILDGVLDSQINLQEINLRELKTQFFNQMEQFPSGGMVSGKINIRGPILNPTLMRGKGTVSVQNVTLSMGKHLISKVGMIGSGQWMGDHLSHLVKVSAFGGEISMEGNLNFKRNNLGELDPFIDSMIIPKSVKLTELTPIVHKEGFLEKGTLSGKIHIKGPILRPQLILAKGDLKTLDTAIRYKNKLVSMPSVNGTGQWSNNRLTHDLKLKVFDGNIRVKGNLKFDKAGSEEKEPVVDSDVVSDSVKLSDIYPLVSKSWFPEKGTLNAKVKVRGPLLIPEDIHAEGRVSILDTSMQFQEDRIPLTAILITGRWFNNRLNHDVRMKVFGGNIKIKGQLSMAGKGQKKEEVIMDSDIYPQSVRLSKIRPLVHKSWFPSKGILMGKAHIKGNILEPESLKSQGSFKLVNLEVEVKESPVLVPLVEMEGAWDRGRLLHDLKLKVFDGSLQVKGKLDFDKDPQGNSVPNINSKAIFSQIALTRLKTLSAQSWFPENGVLNGTIHVKGSLSRLETIKADGKVGLRNVGIRIGERKITLRKMEGKGLWKNNDLAFQTKMNIFDGAIFAKGNLNFKKNEQGTLDPVIDSKLNAQSIQLVHLQPFLKNSLSLKEGTLSGPMDLKGPVKRFSEVRFKGNLSGERVVLGMAEKLLIFQTAGFSFEPNAQNNILIGFDLKDIAIGKLNLKKSSGKMEYSKSTLKLKNGKIFPRTGVMLLKGFYQFDTKGYELDFLGKDMRLEDYKEEIIEGPLKLKGKLYGTVLPEGFKRGLSGNIEIHSETGRILKARGILAQILSVLNFDLFSKIGKGLPFDYIGGRYTISDGIISTDDFKMNSPSLSLLVTGKADLPEETVKAEIIAQPLQVTDKVFRNLNNLIAKSQIESEGKGLLHKSIEKLPLVGEALAGTKEDKESLADKIFQMVPLLGNKRKGNKQPSGLVKVYFSVEGALSSPSAYFMPEKTFGLK